MLQEGLPTCIYFLCCGTDCYNLNTLKQYKCLISSFPRVRHPGLVELSPLLRVRQMNHGVSWACALMWGQGLPGSQDMGFFFFFFGYEAGVTSFQRLPVTPCHTPYSMVASFFRTNRKVSHGFQSLWPLLSLTSISSSKGRIWLNPAHLGNFPFH